jgi:fatty acid desaturase
MKTTVETANQSSRAVGERIVWYRTPLDKETMRALNAKNDGRGFAQAAGHLGLLGLTGAAALWAAAQSLWWLLALAIFLHGTFASFAINAVHELVHKSVFKTQWLNEAFARIYGFLGWIHFEQFYTGHMRHHQFTLHPPDDLEVVLPLKVLTRQFFQTGFVNPLAMRHHIPNALRLARGDFQGEWENLLFPQSEPEKSAPIKRWAKTLLIGHAMILLISLALGGLFSPVWFLIPVLASLTPMYGGWLFFLCNSTQHIGLQDNVSDFRLSCRTFTVNPLVQFLYWHMNYHIEHHMYAAVPCYNLKKLHRAIEHELPPTPDGLIATWMEIASIQKLQSVDPNHQHVVALPPPSQYECEGTPVVKTVVKIVAKRVPAD